MLRNDTLPEQRLDTIYRAVEAFRVGRDGASVLQLAVFILVATRSPLAVHDIKQALQVPATSLSTALSRLVEEEHSHQRVGQPLGLIALEQHPDDRRVKVASLTAKGRHLVLSMRDALT